MHKSDLVMVGRYNCRKMNFESGNGGDATFYVRIVVFPTLTVYILH